MRIRKNTKLSSVLLATAGYGGERQETYVCHLNQSPWDVIPVTSSGDCELTNLLDSSWFLPLSSSSSSSPPLIHQFDGEDSFNGNVSLGDCNGAAVRFNNSMGNNHNLVSVEKLNLNAAEDKYEISPDVQEPMDQSDNSDKKSEDLLEPDSPVKTSGDEDQVGVTMPAPPKRGRPRGTAKKTPASAAASNNPYEFYYYSGFGPRWGRKRGGSDDEKIGMGDNKKSRSSTSSSSDEEGGKTAAFGGGSVSFDGFDYVEEDYVDVMDQYQESDHRRKKKKEKMIMVKKTMKRARKPVKERSLKSLM